MNFREKLDELRKQKRWSQSDVAGAIGEPVATVNEWFLGKRKPTLDKALKLARTLGVPLDYLADDALDEPAPGGLSDDDTIILRIARGMTADEAIRRLSAVPGVFTGVSSDQPRMKSKENHTLNRR